MPRRYTRSVTRKKRLTRAVYGIYVVVVAAFVISNIAQVARALFGAPETETAAAEARFPKVGPDCGKTMEEQIKAIEQARVAASTEPTADAAKARFTSERSSGREKSPAVERACSSDPHGKDALAALARLERAAESHALRTAGELSLVRLGAQSFISGPR